MDYIIFTMPVPLALFCLSLAGAAVTAGMRKYNFIPALICAASAAAAVIAALTYGVPLSEIFACLMLIALLLFVAVAIRGGKR